MKLLRYPFAVLSIVASTFVNLVATIGILVSGITFLNFENLNFGANLDGEPDDDARNFEETEASTVRTSRCPCKRSENENKNFMMLNLWNVSIFRTFNFNLH